MFFSTEFSPRVTLDRISDKSGSGTESKNLVVLVKTENESEAFSDIYNENGDDLNEHSEPKDYSVSADHEPSEGVGKFCVKYIHIRLQLLVTSIFLLS